MKTDAKILRAIDANLNRAVEGLRVVEDGVRFMRDDRALTAQLRELRHALRACAADLPGGNAALLASRDSAGDVARNAAPKQRSGAADLVPVNFKRAQEAVRSLEEFSKIIAPEVSSRFGEIRFRLYDLEKLLTDIKTIKLPAPPFLYLVADYATLSSGGSFEFLDAVLSAGCGIVQLREKNAPDKIIVEMGCEIAQKMKDSGALFFVNDRVDIALACGADGVHLGDEDLPVEAARAISGGGLLIGTSTHSYKQAMAAAKSKPDYIALGPIFESPTKNVRKPLGADVLRRVCRATDLPVVAIGGITAKNVSEVSAAGAAGIAVISAVSASKHPRNEAKKIIQTAKKFYKA